MSRFLFRPVSWIVTTSDDSIVLPSDSFESMMFDIINGDIVGVASLTICMFAHEVLTR